MFVNEYALESALYSLMINSEVVTFSNELFGRRVFTVGILRYLVPKLLERYDER